MARAREGATLQASQPASPSASHPQGLVCVLASQSQVGGHGRRGGPPTFACERSTVRSVGVERGPTSGPSLMHFTPKERPAAACFRWWNRLG